MDDRDAIRCLKMGEIHALEWLVTRYQVTAIRAAFLITRDPQLAEEVVQEAFLQAYRHIDTFDERRPFGPWFFRSVTRAAVKVAQKQAKTDPLGEETEEMELEPLLSPAELSPEAQVEGADFTRRVWEAMEQLSPRQREVAVQRYFLEMSEQEMANALQVAPGTVKWLLHAARLKLRTLLGGERTIL